MLHGSRGTAGTGSPRDSGLLVHSAAQPDLTSAGTSTASSPQGLLQRRRISLSELFIADQVSSRAGPWSGTGYAASCVVPAELEHVAEAWLSVTVQAGGATASAAELPNRKPSVKVAAPAQDAFGLHSKSAANAIPGKTGEKSDRLSLTFIYKFLESSGNSPLFP